MPYELGDPSYYPRWRLRLIVRFEDFGAPNTPAVPARIPTLRKGGKDVGAPGMLQVQKQADGALLLASPGTTLAGQLGGPQDQTTSADGRTHVIDGVVPQSFGLELNGIRMADKLTATCSFLDFPFDPRTIRALGVKFFLGTVTADDAQRGAAGELRPNSTANGSALPFDTIPDTWTDSRNRTRSNLRFTGWADVDALVLDNDQATVEFECADNTRLFIETDNPTQMFVPPNKPIDAAIADYLSSFPKFVGMSVEYRPHVDDSLKPQLDKILSKTAARPKQGPLPAAAHNGPTQQKMTVWDYLTDVCGMVGHIIRVEGTTVVVQRPRTLYEEGFVRDDDPYTPGITVSGQGEQPLVLPVRLYGYGANVNTYRIERTYARHSPTNFEIRSFDTARKKTIFVRYPDFGNRVKSLLPGEAADLKFEVKNVSGIVDPATLALIAQAHYESRNRNEMAVTIKTKYLASFGGDNFDPNALDLREGDPLKIQIVRPDPKEMRDSVQAIATATADELVQLGFEQSLAEAYVTARDAISLPDTFRVRAVKISGQADNGVELEIAAINYIVVALSKTLPEGQELPPTDQQPGAPTPANVGSSQG